MQDRDSLVLLEGILREQGVDFNHLNSYNMGVERDLRNLDGVELLPVELRDGKVLTFRFGNVSFRSPVIIEDDLREVELTPRLARARRENYSARMYVDIHIFTSENHQIKLSEEVVKLGLLRRRKQALNFAENNDIVLDGCVDDDGMSEIELEPGICHRVEPMVYLTAFPVMVGSRLCRLYGLPKERLQEMGEAIYEPGGYFIMRGKERVIVPQKLMAKNTLFISRDAPSGNTDPTKEVCTGNIHCYGNGFQVQRVVNRIIIAHDKDFQDTTIRVVVIPVHQRKGKRGIPLGVLLAALGNFHVFLFLFHVLLFFF
jgi:DNA-directed RNA polymerase beta subunit